MKIDKDHMHYGSALIQVAEDENCVAVRPFRHRSSGRLTSFIINKQIGLHIRYREMPVTQLREYQFVFDRSNLAALGDLATRTRGNTFLALVCVKDREVCCVPYSLFRDLLTERRKEAGAEERYTLIASVVPRKRSRFRVYMNAPGARGSCLGKTTVPRSDFPVRLFRS